MSYSSIPTTSKHVWFKQQVRLTSFLLIISIIALTLADSANALARHPMGWNLTQSSIFAGKISSKITQTDLRIELKDFNLTIISKAPTWDSIVYDRKTHEFFKVSYKELLSLLAALRNNKNANPNVSMETKLSNSNLQIADFRTTTGTVTRKIKGPNGGSQKIADFWIVPDIQVPQKIIDIFGSIVGLTELTGLPVRYYHYKKGETATVYDTTEIKAYPVRDSDFHFPNNYKNGGTVTQLINRLFGNIFSDLDDEGIKSKSIPSGYKH